MFSQAIWSETRVTSPLLESPVEVIAVKDVPYVPQGHRLQTLNIYARSAFSKVLSGQTLSTLPIARDSAAELPRWHVHVHGGAWRDPDLSATSIEAAVAHAFAQDTDSSPIDAIVSINYTLSPFPTHPTKPYDLVKDKGKDPAREAQHPDHIKDVLQAFQSLRSLGLTDNSFIWTGHSCGAFLSFQAALQSPQYWGCSGGALTPPRPAVLIGLNGLYDLEKLVQGLGPTHAQLSGVYDNLERIAFGEPKLWKAASPGQIDPQIITQRLQAGFTPRIVILDQSTEDQLVPMNEMEGMLAVLQKVDGMRVVQGDRCTGVHAAPWEQGIMIWQSVQDALKMVS